MSVAPDEPAEPGVLPGHRRGHDVTPDLGDKGASAFEYALLIGLIALVVFAVLAILGANVHELFSSVSTGF